MWFGRFALTAGALALGLLGSNPAAAQTVAISTNGNQGWFRNDGVHYASNTNYLTGFLNSPTEERRSFFQFNLGSLDTSGKVVTGAELRLRRFTQLNAPVANLALWDVTSTINGGAEHTGSTDIFNDLGSGVSYGTASVPSGAVSDIVTLTLNASALTAIQNAAGSGTFQVGIDLTDPGTNLPSIFFSSNYGNDQDLVVTLADAQQEPLTTPEPASALLLVPSLALLRMLKKRKSTRGA